VNARRRGGSPATGSERSERSANGERKGERPAIGDRPDTILAMSAREPLFTARFAALWSFAFVTFFSAFQLLPAIPFRIMQLGGSTAKAGWFLAVYTYASAFAAPLMGSLADHIGRKRQMIVISIGFVVFSFAYGVVTYLPLLLAIGAVHGAMWSGLIAAASAIMSDYIPASRRNQGLAWWGLASTAAVAIAPAVGLWVFHFGWLTLCIELVVLSLLMMIGAFFLRSDDAPRPAAKLKLADSWDWRVTQTTLSLTVATFGYGGITTYSAIVAMQRHIEPRAIYLTVFAVTIVVYRICFSHLGDRVGTKVVLFPALTIIPVAFALLAIATTKLHFILSAILFGLGFGAAYPAFASFILSNTDHERRARTFGSIVWAFDTGIGTGSLVIGSLGERYSMRAAFLFAAGLSCFSIPIFVWSSRHLTVRGTSLAASAEHARPE
jgi:MFS family permease